VCFFDFAIHELEAKGQNLPMSQSDSAETRFWSLIEEAWQERGTAANDARNSLTIRDPDEGDADTEAVDEVLDDVIAYLRAQFNAMPQDELALMDRVLERKLYDIDRQEIQEVTDGSDDGFLYARGFIVILGKAFYDAVNENPALAILDAECEDACYLPAHVHAARFGGDFPEHESGISRESCSNRAGWADD